MNKNRTLILRKTLLAAALLISLAASASPLSPGQRRHTLHYDRPGRFFEESLVIGNGKLGAAWYGSPSRQRFSLNDITLWTGEPDTRKAPAGLPDSLRKVRALLDANNFVAAEQANTALEGHYSENYQPLGTLYISHRDAANPRIYTRSLDLTRAIASEEFTAGNYGVRTECFASSPDSVIVIRLTATGRKPLDFSASLTSLLPHKTEASGRRLQSEGYAAATSLPIYLGGIDNDKKHTYDPARGTRFRTLLEVIPGDCRVSAEGDSLHISGGRQAILLLTNATSFNGPFRNPATEGLDYRRNAESQLRNASARSYKSLLGRHTSDYRKLYDRVKLDLGSTPDSLANLPTDRQLRLYSDASTPNPELEALYYNFGRYLLISSSRTPGIPANLQGLWNEKLLPPWSSNYTVNINLEENYWGAETGNLSELHLPLMKFLTFTAENGRRTARDFYGVQSGWCLGHNSDVWAMTNPVGDQDGHPSWACWNMGGAWLATHIWEHYLFSQDKEELRRMYPVLMGAARFCRDWLIEKDGYLMTSPSTSPENIFLTPDKKPVATTYGATADLAIIRECMTAAAAAAHTLGVDPEEAQSMRSALARLAPYKIGKKGSLQEWWTDFDEYEPTHRHQSHLIGLYPGHHLTPETTPELAAAALRTLELRGPKSTGWSTGWRVNLYARLLEAERAYATYRMLLRLISPDGYKGKDARRGGGTYPNLLDAHSPFQIDGNFGGSAGVAEMLLQSSPEKITLLPALPKAWSDGSVSGLKARGGFTMSFEWKAGRVNKATISSQKGGATTLRVNGRDINVELKPGQSKRVL